MYPEENLCCSQEVGWATDCADFKQMKEGQANEENQKGIMTEFWDWTGQRTNNCLHV